MTGTTKLRRSKQRQIVLEELGCTYKSKDPPACPQGGMVEAPLCNLREKSSSKQPRTTQEGPIGMAVGEFILGLVALPSESILVFLLLPPLPPTPRLKARCSSSRDTVANMCADLAGPCPELTKPSHDQHAAHPRAFVTSLRQLVPRRLPVHPHRVRSRSR